MYDKKGDFFVEKVKKQSASVIKARKKAGFLPYYIYVCARGDLEKFFCNSALSVKTNSQLYAIMISQTYS